MADSDKTPKNETGKKINSPYDLSSNDNPGNVITQVKLRGDENYEEWARSIRTSLRARRKWSFVDGSISEPQEGSPELEDWWTVQSMLVSWIRNTIESDLRSTISHMENAKDLWEDIEERFHIANGPRIQQIKTELNECKQHGLSMVVYYGKMKALWDELANYDQIPTCTCTGCKCKLSAKLEKRREEEKVHQFLMGLDEGSYGTVRSNLLATEPLPTLNKVYLALAQEERMKIITRAREDRGEVIGLAVQTNTRLKGRGETKDNTMICPKCNRTGHDSTSCFQLIGYPEWWGDRPRGEGRAGGRGRGGQQRTRTGRGRSGTVRANAAQITEGTASALAVIETDSEKSGLAGLSNEQWQNLLQLLNSHKPSTSEKMTGNHINNPWIIDTGASNHMTGSLKNMSELRGVSGCPVGLPDGQYAAATKEGSVKLDENLELKNVLYVPRLNCNLISVSQLIDESDCIAQFTKNMCVFQDRTSRMLIGAGKRRDGLYHFRKASCVKALKTDGTNSLDCWHRRLGHPSVDITKLVLSVRNGRNSVTLIKLVMYVNGQNRLETNFF
ncbi:uncharacterized protein [Primulina huaijiensis]|uniref:uncharacterized protein n=1 Tax=Primulina huaijiensis TaxID=1492673 RepID=UPI003CC700E6